MNKIFYLYQYEITTSDFLGIKTINYGARNGLPYIDVNLKNDSINLFEFLNNQEILTLIYAIRDISGVVLVAGVILYLIRSIPALLDGDLG